jgi:glycosyltransferase involved in cell wall biosynthesis
MRPRVVGIIMTWNSASTLERVYRELPTGVFDEIILVDDGSSDETLKVANELGIRTFAHTHLGYGGNIKYGLAKALEMGAEHMVEIHGDGQYDMSNVQDMLTLVRAKKHDLLLGSRFMAKGQARRDGMPLLRYVANRGLSFVARLVLGLQLSEFHTGYHIYSRDFVEKAGFEGTSNSHLYSFEIIVQALYHRLSICEAPVRCDYLREHTSISIGKSAVYAVQMSVVLMWYLLARVGVRSRLFRV